MTLIAVFQGKKCALLASDLQVRFAEENQLALPVELRTYKTLISEKFRKLPNGDYLAFNGRLNLQEYSVLASKSLDELLSVPLVHEPSIRNDQDLVIFYASIPDAQLYAAHFTQPLTAAQRGQPFAGADEIQHAHNLMDITEKFRRGKKFDKEFLRQLSAKYERYFLDAERNTDSFGGFTSYIVSPRKIRPLTRNLGKLEGCQEAYLDTEGNFSID
ncbi:hypothetical protein HYW21_08340 [Candidatus Woesearchaeota archaeon]|nr:hypothetical protein [Candidatus Woesearchaeota archaeon]